MNFKKRISLKVSVMMLFVFILAFLLIPCSVFAGRPLLTEDARTVGKDSLQLEFGQYFTQFRDETRESWQYYTLSAGLSDSLDLTAGKAHVYSIPVDGPLCDGEGDTLLGLKARFFDETPKLPAWGVRFDVDLNDGGMIGGTGTTELCANLFASKRIGDFQVHANLGYIFLDINELVNESNILTYSIAAEKPVSSRITIVGEIIGLASRQSPCQSMGQIGLQYEISPSVTLDMGYLSGFTYDTPKSSLTVGATIVFF